MGSTVLVAEPALPGAGTHGAAYAAGAQHAGAVAVLTDAQSAALAADAGLPVLVVDDPRRLLGDMAAWVLRTTDAVPLLLAVTGTNGKTTTVTLIDHLLRRLEREPEQRLARGMPFPTTWDPYFQPVMTLAEVYAYPVLHYRHHRAQLTLDP